MITRNISIARATSEIDIGHCFAIRHAVFVIEQKVAPELERDTRDTGAVHLLAHRDGVPVGTARAVLAVDAMFARIGRVAVLKDARGSGVGAALMRAFPDQPSLQRITRFELHAQVEAIAFYERLGYVALGELFHEAGIPHVAMALSRR